MRPAPRPVKREEQAAARPAARKPSNSRRSESKQPERGRAPAASKNPSRNEKDHRAGGRGKKVHTPLSLILELLQTLIPFETAD